MNPPLAWLDTELAALRAENLYRRRRVITSLPEGYCEVEGRRLLNLAGNDYLALRHDPRVIAAAQESLKWAGTGSGASALVTGRTPWHAALEERLAQFEGQEAAILYPTGYAANMGALASLAGAEDVIYCDRLNHASLVDGSRVSGAKLRVYRRGELDELAGQLEKGKSFRRRLIVTDAIFSMDGDCAPLPDLCDLADRFDALLIVDEAHSTGVFGDHGRGVAEWQGIERRGAVRTGTLSKAVGALGGFVTGSNSLIDWLWNKSRTQIYSTALPAHVCAAAKESLDIIATEPQRRIHVHEIAAEFRVLLREADIETRADSIGPIVPVILHDPERASLVAQRLEARGYLVAAIRPPTVPHGTSRLRVSLCAAHTRDDLKKFAKTLAEELATLATGN